MRIRFFAAAALMLAAGAARAAVVISDGDFAGWLLGSYAVGGGSASVTVEAAGGNPGARLNVTTVTAGPTQTAFGTAIEPDFSTTEPLAGRAFTASFDALSGAGAFGEGQAVQLLVEQGGAIYALPIGGTGVLAACRQGSLGGSIVGPAGSLVGGAGPASPNFAGGTATRFGLAAGNTNSATLTQYYDNFVLDIAPLAAPSAGVPVPTLGAGAVPLLAALLGAIVLLRRRR